MAIAAMSFSLSSSSPSNLSLHHRRSLSPPLLPPPLTISSATKPLTPLSISSNLLRRSPSHIRRHIPIGYSDGDSGEGGNFGGSGGGGGGEGGGDHGGSDNDDNKNKKDAFLILSEIGRSVDSLPKDLAGAIEEGRIPVEIVRKYLELEKSAFMRWLLQFEGFRERLLADDLFLAKVGMECGVGVFTKVCSFLI